MITLNSIANIRTGYTFREKVEEVAVGGNAYVVQIKDVRKIHQDGISFNLPVVSLPQSQTSMLAEFLHRAST